MESITIKVSNLNQKNKKDIANILKLLNLEEVIKKGFGEKSIVEIKIVAERIILLEKLKELLFKNPVLNRKPIFSGHKEIIVSYYIKENLSYKSQKVCVSQFFSGRQNQDFFPPRIWDAVLEKINSRDKNYSHILNEIREVLLELSSNSAYPF